MRNPILFLNSVIYVLIVVQFIAGCSLAPVVEPRPRNTKADSSYFLSQPEIHPFVAQSTNPMAQDELIYRMLLSEIAGQRGYFDTAMENMLIVARQIDNPEVAERLTRISIYAKNLEMGKQAVQRWLELEPADEEALHIAAELELKRGDSDAALHYIRRIVALGNDQQGSGFISVVRLLSTEKDQATALKLMQRLVDEHKHDPYAIFAYGSLALHFREYDSAKHLLKSALILKPDLHDAMVAKVRIMQAQGEVEQASKMLAEALQRYPHVKVLQLAYGRLLVNAKQYEMAVAHYEKVLLTFSYSEEVVYMLALLTLDLKQLVASERYLNRLLEHGDRLDEAHYYLGRIAELREQHKEAIHYYRGITQGSYYIDAQTRVAFMLGKLGQIQQARRHLQGLRAVNPEVSMQLKYYLVESEILREHDLYEESLHVLTQALSLIPQSNELLYARALVAEKLNKLEMTEQDLRAILVREPENADALNALGYTLANRTSRHDEAYTLIKEAMRLKPDDAAITDSMGWVLYHLGQHREAIHHLRKALLLQQDPEIAAHLGEVLWISGNQDAAREIWQKALESTPGHEGLLEIMQRFK